MDPFLKRAQVSAAIGQSSQANHLAVREHNLQTDHQVGNQSIAGHAVADAAFGHHGTDDDGRAVTSVVGQHQTMLPQGVVDRINAGASFGNHVLESGIDFQDLVHPEHVQEDPPPERRADSHADAAFGDDRDLMLVGEGQNLG